MPTKYKIDKKINGYYKSTHLPKTQKKKFTH